MIASPADLVRADLARFEDLLDRAERVLPYGLRRFNAARDRSESIQSGDESPHSMRRGGVLAFTDWRELGRLYRAHAARLARERQRDDDPEARRHLNALCVRAHTLLSVAPPVEGSLVRAAGRRIGAALGRTWRAQLLAWALLLLGGGVGAALSSADPEALHALIPGSLGYSTERIDRLAGSEKARLAFLEGHETPAGMNAIFGSYLFVNNTRVGFLSFATGILAGVPTVLLQLYNGMMLGAIAWVFLHGASTWPFLAWILPHGIPELTAISWCVAGGLMLGQAVAAPLRQRRSDALREALDSAVLMVLGAIPLFLVAAVIESYVRESALGLGARFAVAAAMLALLGGLLWSVRRLSRGVVDTSWLRDLAR